MFARTRALSNRVLAAGLATATLAGVSAAFVVLPAGPATAAAPAAFTTVNEAVDGTGHCQNGNPGVNCNIYDDKQYVWMNGGPADAQLADGTYMFAVLAPGGQADPADGAANNLSDDVDAYTNRTFSVSGGALSYGGSHDFAGNEIRLAGYADTPNPGGVYVLAICSLANGYPPDAKTCKYDAFKVVGTGVVVPPLADLSAIKTAASSLTDTYSWAIDKSVDQTRVEQVGGTATFNYTVAWTRSGPTESDWAVSGVVSVFNLGAADATGVTVSDAIPGATCVVSDSTSTITAGAAHDYPYTCTFASAPTRQGTNVASVSWTGPAPGGGPIPATAPYDFDAATVTSKNACATVSDTYAGSLGSPCDSGSTSYSRTVPVPQFNCVSYDNTATFTTTDPVTTGSDSQTITVCGPVKTGALTIGFWQNKNGQGIIKAGSSTAGVCNSTAWLRQLAPFQDLASNSSCSAVATYVTNVIKAANASGPSMNAMLKAQMLATALDVYFSDPALGGNQIGAPSPIGAVAIDLTKICTNIGVCSNYIDSSSAFGGSSSLTVSQILAYAAGQSNAGGTIWYANVKSVQERAKDVFDAINNQVAFSA
jgi:hypothetical protein